MWLDRKNKKAAREFVCGLPTKTAKCVLLLPGQDLACLKLLVENGTIGNGTQVLAVEREPEIAVKISKELRKYARKGINGVVIPGDLWELNLSLYIGDCQVDFCYLDTCSQLTESAMKWFMANKRCFAKNMELVVVFCIVCRQAGVTQLVNKLGRELVTARKRKELLTKVGHLQGPEAISHGIIILPWVGNQGLQMMAILEDVVGRPLSFSLFYRDAHTWMITCGFCSP